MWSAHLLCSDPECAEALVALAPTQAELEAHVCDCGCAFVLLHLEEATVVTLGEPAEVVTLAAPRGATQRRAAA